MKESDIPAVLKRDKYGNKFSGWYSRAGKNEDGTIKYVKFDLNAGISHDIVIFPR